MPSSAPITLACVDVEAQRGEQDVCSSLLSPPRRAPQLSQIIDFLPVGDGADSSACLPPACSHSR